MGLSCFLNILHIERVQPHSEFEQGYEIATELHVWTTRLTISNARPLGADKANNLLRLLITAVW